MKTATNTVKLLAALVLGVAASKAQQLDDTWRVSVNGQQVSVRPDGTFRIDNISSADQFGPGGPGTRPDFQSDEPMYLIGVSRANGVTRWAYSEPFRIDAGRTYLVGPLTITDVPPPLPAVINLDLGVPSLVVSNTAQATVSGLLFDGMTSVDVTAGALGTNYRTSSAAIATVDADGLVTGNAAGRAFITARNGGVTSVRELIVTDVADPGTTVVGFVFDTSDNPVAGATVMIAGQELGMAVSAADGSFSIPNVPTVLGDLTVEAELFQGMVRLRDQRGPLTPMPEGFTDAGRLVIAERNSLAVLASLNTTSNNCPLGTGAVHVVDGEAGSILTSQNFGVDVLDVAIDPTGSTAIISSFCARQLLFVSLQQNPPVLLGTVPIPFNTEDVDVACVPGGYVLCSGGGNNTEVYSIEIATRRIVNSVTLPVSAESVDVSPDGTYAFCTATAQDVIRQIRIDQNGQIFDSGMQVAIGTDPINSTISPRGDVVLVAHDNDTTIGIINMVGSSIANFSSMNLTGISRTQTVAFHPDGDRAFVLDPGGVLVPLLIDSAGDVTDSGVRVPLASTTQRYFGVDQASCTSDGRFVMVHHSGFVSVYSTTDYSLVSTIAIPNDAGGGGISIIP